MFSLFSDNEMNFDVVSSPIADNDMKQQDTDFTMNFNPQSPSKVGDISSVDQDFFSDFSSFEPTLTMSPGLGTAQLFNFNFQEQPQIQPQIQQIQQVQQIQQIQPCNKGIVMPDVCINRASIINKSNSYIPNMNSGIIQKASIYPIPSTNSKENINSNIQFNSYSQKQTHKDMNNNIPKKQKLKRKCEVFQPFSSFANLELTVKSLRNIVKNNSNSNYSSAPTNSRTYAPPPQPMIALLA